MALYSITIRERVTPRLRALVSGTRSGRFFQEIGYAGVYVLADHFARKGLEPAKHESELPGSPKTQLYGQFAKRTQYQVEGDSTILSIAHPAVRQRLLGGEIKPVNAKNLTIPAIAAAYGHRAREAGITLKFKFAFDERLQKWRPALVAPEAVTKEYGKARKDGTRRRRTVKPSGIWYWLVKSVTQEGDETVLPPRRDLLSGIKIRIRDYIQDVLAGRI